MSKQGSFIAKTILWTVLMILGLSGALISGIFLTLKSPYAGTFFLLLLGMVSGLVFFAYSLRQIITGEQAWKQDTMGEILQNESEQVVQWKYTSEQWAAFKQGELEHRKKAPMTAAVSVAICMLIGIGIGYFTEDMNNEVLMIVLSLLPVVAGMVWWIANASVGQIKKGYEAKKEGEVVLGLKGAVVNQSYLIPFKFFGGKLTQVKRMDHYGMSTLCFTVRTQAGRNDSHQDYHIPIPAGQDAEADLVKQRFQGVYDLPRE